LATGILVKEISFLAGRAIKCRPPTDIYHFDLSFLGRFRAGLACPAINGELMLKAAQFPIALNVIP
jgi:hypothetical protein